MTLINYLRVPHVRGRKKKPPMLFYIYHCNVSKSEMEIFGGPSREKNKIENLFVFHATRKNMRILVEIASKLPYEKLRGKFQHDNLNNVVVATILGKHKK